ncbi:DUF5392 family protein [Calidifontibacillus oryziterrae]|nr:DUF5392 family protein [Calidifontibacillus oryziterrae]
MINLMANMPYFVKKELEHLNEKIAPLMKKSAIYVLWSLPLVKN